MATPKTALLGQLERVLGAGRRARLPDRQLLEQFTTERDQAAFAVLVRRYGPMVLNVCRRVLHNAADAEDAFQATFLVLARKAVTISKREAVPAWLHRVALRVALRTRATASKRREHEKGAVPRLGEDPLAGITARELLTVLDAELNALPEKNRGPLVLCYLAEQKREEVARQLGLPIRTLDRRLEQGRQMLRRRLERRGLTMATTLLAVDLFQGTAKAALSGLLVATTVKAAVQASAGHGLAGLVSGQAALLVNGTVRAMALSKAMSVGVMVATVVLVGMGITLAAQLSPGAHQAPVAKVVQAATTTENHVHTDLYGDPLPPGAIARLGTVRWRSGLGFALLRCLGDGKTILSLTNHFKGITIRWWDLDSGRVLRRFETGGNKGWPPLFALSADNRTLASIESDGDITLWDIPAGKILLKLKVLSVTSATLSPDGKALATIGADSLIRLWNVATGAELRQFIGHRSSVLQGEFSPDGKLLASISFDTTLRFWDTATGKEIRWLEGVASREEGNAIVFSPDGHWLAWTNNEDHTIRLADPATGKVIHKLNYQQPVPMSTSHYCPSLAFSPDSKLLASTDNGRLWDVATGKEVRRLQGLLPWWPPGGTAVAFSPDGKQLVAGDNAIRTWDVATGKELHQAKAAASSVEAIISPDGRRVVTTCSDGVIRIWDPLTGRQIRQLQEKEPEPMLSAAFSPNGQVLFTTGFGNRVRLWDVATGREVGALRRPDDDIRGSNYGLACSPDGKLVASGQRLRVWETATGKILEQLPPPRQFCGELVFSSDSRMLATAGQMQPNLNTGVLVFDLKTGQELARWENPAGTVRGSIVFAPDNKSLLAFEQSRSALPIALVRLDLSTKHVSLHMPLGDWKGSAVISPDGRAIAFYHYESREIPVWEIASAKIRRRFPNQEAGCVSMVFSSDGKRLVSGNVDTTAVVWDLTGLVGVTVPANLGDTQMQRLWDDLKSGDARKAGTAIWTLAAVPQKSLSYLKERLRPVRAEDTPEVSRLIADLDSPNFRRRQAAKEQLAALGDRAEPGLSTALLAKPSEEQRRTIVQLLEALHVVRDPETLRHLRALEVLEHVGTAEAQTIIHDLSEGLAGARVTREAKDSLQRLKKRQGYTP